MPPDSSIFTFTFVSPAKAIKKPSPAVQLPLQPEDLPRCVPCQTPCRLWIPPNGSLAAQPRQGSGRERLSNRSGDARQPRRGNLTDFAALQRAGAVAVTDDGKPILDDEIMRTALQLGAELNLPVVQHAEDTRVTENCSMNAGPSSFRLGSARNACLGRSSDRRSRCDIGPTDSRCAIACGASLDCDALKAVRRGKRAKARVTCEVTPHHFALIDENVGEYDTHFKMNPPLRSAADREAILVALADGTVDAIATDHAPHAAHEKQVEFERASFGITGLETALGLAISQFHREHKIPLARIIELFTAGPANVFDLPNRGSLAPGNFADVTIFDPKKRWTFEADKSHSMSHNTPFDGWQFTGRVIATIVGGKIVYRES